MPVSSFIKKGGNYTSFAHPSRLLCISNEIMFVRVLKRVWLPTAQDCGTLEPDTVIGNIRDTGPLFRARGTFKASPEKSHPACH